MTAHIALNTDYAPVIRELLRAIEWRANYQRSVLEKLAAGMVENPRLIDDSLIVAAATIEVCEDLIRRAKALAQREATPADILARLANYLTTEVMGTARYTNNERTSGRMHNLISRERLAVQADLLSLIQNA